MVDACGASSAQLPGYLREIPILVVPFDFWNVDAAGSELVVEPDVPGVLPVPGVEDVPGVATAVGVGTCTTGSGVVLKRPLA